MKQIEFTDCSTGLELSWTKKPSRGLSLAAYWFHARVKDPKTSTLISLKQILHSHDQLALFDSLTDVYSRIMNELPTTSQSAMFYICMRYDTGISWNDLSAETRKSEQVCRVVVGRMVKLGVLGLKRNGRNSIPFQPDQDFLRYFAMHCDRRFQIYFQNLPADTPMARIIDRYISSLSTEQKQPPA